MGAIKMVKRSVLVGAVAVVLVWGQTMPVSADTGFTANNFRLTHAVADIGATATITLQGTIDRDLWGQYMNVQNHGFDLQQPCQNLTNPTDTIVATATINWQYAHFVSTVVVPPEQKGAR